ncbi:TetR/AcrR family transcriptional regulator [Streptomyces prunicolor]|uniref:TetR/AcrR family transcriptional regulator n=1 Tax=Streptomyces prunicolor TaxID=67348 RepID=UPI0037D6994D
MTAPSGRTGRPPLTEARKTEIRLEIARAAVELFVAQGVTATTGEQIGQAVGVSARTVWRYFPSKESCVRPLFSAGIDVIAARLREWPPGQALAELFDPALATGVLAATGPDGATGTALVRLTRTEPGLRAIWLQTYDEAEPAFAQALAHRAGLPADDLRPMIQAAMLNAALRAAVERFAWRRASEGGVTDEAPGVVTDVAPGATLAAAEVAEALRSALVVAAGGVS